jgi:lysozyme
MIKFKKYVALLLIAAIGFLNTGASKKSVKYNKKKKYGYSKKSKKHRKVKRTKKAVAINYSRISVEGLLCKNIVNEKIRTNQYKTGIDISRYQNINFDQLDTNLHFVICKATEGTRIIDRKFNYHWNNIKNNTRKGAYHYFLPHISGKEQAKLFLNTVPFEKGNILPVLDVEQCYAYRKCKKTTAINNLVEMILEIENTLGVKPIIYTNARFWNVTFSEKLKPIASDYHLWIADYRNSDEPGIPLGWSDWSIWQHSCKGKISGIKSDVDLNVCKIDLDKLTIQ